MLRILFLLVLAIPAWAREPLRICLYGDSRGSNPVHREILRQAHAIKPRLFFINGDAVKHDYENGSLDAVFEDYRSEFASLKNPMTMWPQGPGPAVFAVPGGHDEQYFIDSKLAAIADTSRGGRYAFEGTNTLGVQIYEAFDLEAMRLRVQALPDIEQPLPMSPYGDYLLTVGAGSRRDIALLILYRTDRWGFRREQIDWVDSTLTHLRATAPQLPLLVIAHDWTWIFPDTLDDGRLDGPRNGIRVGTPQEDSIQKKRLWKLLDRSRMDAAFASDRHAYYAELDSSVLKINSAAAICHDPDGRRISEDTAWLEYAQDDTALYVTAHPVEPPIGCGIREQVAASGLAFQKSRSAGAVWRKINP